MGQVIQKDDDVSVPTDRVVYLRGKRKLCRDLYGGTDTMLKAGEKWLLKLPAESDENYKMRLQQNILTNFFQQAVKRANGKIFSKPIELKETPEEIENLIDNIDNQGNSLNSFMFDRGIQAFIDGVSYAFVDMPKSEGVVTAADEKIKGIRPYVVAINANDILEILTANINNVKTLVRLRFVENVTVPSGKFGQKEIQQVRVFYRTVTPIGEVTYEIYRLDSTNNWAIFESGKTTFTDIQLVPFYTNRVGFMEGEPVFQNTAELNLEHYRSKSEQLNALMFGRFAMLGGSGVPVDAEVEIGPSKKLFNTDVQSKFYYVESNGVGLEHGWTHLKNVADSIETASAQLRVENKGRVTATAAALESDEINSGLKAVAEVWGESTEQIFRFFALMMKMDKEIGEVIYNTNFGIQKGTDTGLQEISRLTIAGKMSGESAMRNLIWRGELPSDFDIDQNTEELKSMTPLNSNPPTQKDVNVAKLKKEGAQE